MTGTTTLGADPDELERIGILFVDAAKAIDARIEAFRTIRPWLLGPSSVVVLKYLRTTLSVKLKFVADALREMGTVLTANALAQQQVSAGQEVDWATVPQYQRRVLSPEQRAVVGGVAQIGGGVLQVGGSALGGLAALAAPEPVSKLVGVPAAAAGIALGADSIQAGLRSVIERRPHQTNTHKLAAAGARAMGASDRTAETIGAGVELGANLASGVGLASVRNAAAVGEVADNALILATRQPSPLNPGGHSIVGSRVAGQERVFEITQFKDGSLGLEVRQSVVETLRRPAARLSVHELPATEDQARAVRQTLRQIRDRYDDGQTQWRPLGPNCSTVACEALNAGGAQLPPLAGKHPWLLDRALKEWPTAGPGKAATAGGTLGTTGGSLDQQPKNKQ